MENALIIASKAKDAKFKVSVLDTDKKNEIIKSMADALVSRCSEILDSNETDLKNAQDNGISGIMLDRLKLTGQRISDMAHGLLDIISLPDPIGEVVWAAKRPNGLSIAQKRVPLGVVGIIYEARPNVTADAIGLCIKSGNCVVLKGGKEALNSNIKIAEVMREAAVKKGLPEGTIGLIEDTSRQAANEMMKLNGIIDVLIPRGGAGLIKTVTENSTVPIIETGTGNCHIYVDRTADFEMAINIILNAKTSRPSVCNAAESVVIHKDIAFDFFPKLLNKLNEAGVEVRGCDICASMGAKPATEDDYRTEYLDYIISVKVVNSLDEAISHINKYSTGHSEAIITDSYFSAEKFKAEIDSAAVYVNASTRFTDGFEFGFGAEIGISTQMLHARGPMGLNALTSSKFVIDGNGQIR